MYRAPTRMGEKHGACGKTEDDRHHKGCGRSRETIQAFAEMLQRGARTAQKDRRKPGVTRRNAESEIKNSSKILLTENGGHTILPLRQ
jgi:hypothetical protein